jgi:hypothetical protein
MLRHLNASASIAARALADSAKFSIIGQALSQDVKNAIGIALTAGATFPTGKDPLSVFRATLSESIRDIECHPLGVLFRTFLTKGPYVDSGRIPVAERYKYLADDDVARVTAFIHSFMVNSFKGAVAELLAAGTVARLVQTLEREGSVPAGARVFVGDTVFAMGTSGRRWRKGADLTILAENKGGGGRAVCLVGVVEVKSYFRSAQRLNKQINQHIRRARRGLLIRGSGSSDRKIIPTCGVSEPVIRISVQPADWRLRRFFCFRKHGDSRRLHVSPAVPPNGWDKIEQIGPQDWRITLRWSKEALAEAAYEMTFWYMGKFGEALYSDPEVKPKEWAEMTPTQAGRNAAKMMLYYSILRARSRRDEQRAIALYNTYGFGYALGMNFCNSVGQRRMLWPRDLDEIKATGRNKDGYRIVL